VRIGYTSGGFGPLLTHPVRWSDAERPMADQYRDLLDRLTPERPFPAAALRPRREHDTLAAQPADMAGLGPYLVIHPGAGSVTRYWGNDRWEAMMTHLGERPGGCRIVLTGAGAADVALAEELARRFPDAVNMAGRIGWEEFVRVIADAALVICPDTATGHVAALFDVPTVSLFTGTNSPAKWAPYSDHVHVLTRPVACAPCNRLGCEVMACFRGISPTDVAEAALAMLSARVPR
jgi:ADP-heptose:LPS heptosyltransferase